MRDFSRLAASAAVAAVVYSFGIVPAAASKEPSQGPQIFDLRVTSYNSTDECSSDPANENGVWEPGETIDLSIELWLQGGGFVYTGILGTLSTSNPGVVFLEDTATWPDMALGQMEFNDAPFRLTLTDDIDCFEDAGLSLSLSTDQISFGPYVIPNVVGAGFVVDLPLHIPDITFGTELPLEVLDDIVIEDLDVHIVVEHTWVGDLGFTLRSPAGTETLLLDRPGVPALSPFGCSNDDMDITFDDASTFDPEDYCPGTNPWYIGDANPVGELSDFDGESTRGTWTLIITDGGGGDLGDLLNFELLATPEIEGPCNTCGGGAVPAVGVLGLILMVLVLGLIGTATLLATR